tara:strand:- start:4479 stop:5039 length:561 start_codon:yes stop_codon:yes gene_type:complete
MEIAEENANQEITLYDKINILIDTMEELLITYKPLTKFDLKEIVLNNETIESQINSVKVKINLIHNVRKHDGRINLHENPLLNFTVYKYPEYYKYNKDIICCDMLKIITNTIMYLFCIYIAGSFIVIFTGVSLVNEIIDPLIIGFVIYILWRWCLICCSIENTEVGCCVHPIQIVFDDEKLNPHRY